LGSAHAQASGKSGNDQQDGGKGDGDLVEATESRGGCGGRGWRVMWLKDLLRSCSVFDRVQGRFGVAVPSRSNRRDKPIAAAGQGFDEARVFGRVAQGFTQLINRCTEAVVEVNDGVVAPEAVLNFFTGHDFAGAFE
jgi:hypothetical protein